MKDQNLYTCCEELKVDFIELWEQLVNIDTGSGYGTGINKTAQIVAAFLSELGAKVKLISTANIAQGSHVVGVFEGHGQGKVLAMAHLDTVFPEGTAAQRPFCIRDGWAYGPGVSDCKGSVVLCLFALKILGNLKFDNYERITVLFNCDEEIGSLDSQYLIKKLAQEHDYTLCLEPGQVGDGVIIWRKGIGELKLEAFGKASHAGSNPESGINSIMELVHQIQQFSSLEDPKKMTSLNFTKIVGGDRLNVIPAYAAAYADVRAVYPEEFVRLEQAATSLIKQTVVPGVKVKVTLELGNPPFPQNAGSDALISLAQDIYYEIDRKLKLAGGGGVSDANWAAAEGATVMDGLGPVKGGANHSEDESSDLSSIVPRLYLLTRLFMRLGEKSDLCR